MEGLEGEQLGPPANLYRWRNLSLLWKIFISRSIRVNRWGEEITSFYYLFGWEGGLGLTCKCHGKEGLFHSISHVSGESSLVVTLSLIGWPLGSLGRSFTSGGGFSPVYLTDFVFWDFSWDSSPLHVSHGCTHSYAWRRYI